MGVTCELGLGQVSSPVSHPKLLRSFLFLFLSFSFSLFFFPLAFVISGNLLVSETSLGPLPGKDSASSGCTIVIKSEESS